MKLRIPLRIFSQQVYKGENLEERFWFDGNNLFCSNPCNGTLLQKTVLLLNMSHIELNEVFQVFRSIFEEIDKKIIFKD